jgi:putative ATP-binding cassette transporter
MAEVKQNAPATAMPEPALPISLRSQIGTMLAAFNGSALRRQILWMAVTALAVIVATSLMQIVLNRWNRPFYDAIERKDLSAFFHQLELFVGIAFVLLALGVGQTWLNQMVRLRLREALTLDLIEEWLRPRRAFRLANAGAIGVNPDQRLQQDAGHLADLTTGLSFGFVQSSILLVSFVGVLWSLSAGFSFQWNGQSFAIPGYMVWAAFLYAGSASLISWLVARPLIELNSDRYAQEADLRFSMVRVNENVDAIALAGGEGAEKRRLHADLDELVAAIRRIYKIQIRLEWVTDGYGWITLIAPILVAAPIYFSGDMTFGGLMMAVGAFNQVHSSLRWFINNIGAIADWRATLLRVSAFRLALLDAEKLHGEEDRLVVEANAKKTLTLDNLDVVSPAGCTRLEEEKVEIKQGERVLITGDPAAGKTLLFRAIACLWPWGKGRIGLPNDEPITFVPRTPYFTPGTLRSALASPENDDAYADQELKASLQAVGLDRLTGSLDRDARWDRELSEEEQRLLAFARLALHKPKWVIIDEALDTLDASVRQKVLAMFEARLGKATIINVGRQLKTTKFFTRELHLTKDCEGRRLKPVDLDARVKATRATERRRLAKAA